LCLAPSPFPNPVSGEIAPGVKAFAQSFRPDVRAFGTSVWSFRASVRSFGTFVRSLRASVRDLGASVRSLRPGVRTFGTTVRCLRASVRDLGACVRSLRAHVRTFGTTVRCFRASVRTFGTTVWVVFDCPFLLSFPTALLPDAYCFFLLFFQVLRYSCRVFVPGTFSFSQVIF
jgi:hypothetical protein